MLHYLFIITPQKITLKCYEEILSILSKERNVAKISIRKILIKLQKRNFSDMDIKLYLPTAIRDFFDVQIKNLENNFRLNKIGAIPYRETRRILVEAKARLFADAMLTLDRMPKR